MKENVGQTNPSQDKFLLAESLRSFAPGTLMQFLYFEMVGLTNSEAGLIFVISGLMSLCFSPIFGILGGSIGYSIILPAGYFFCAAGALGLALATQSGFLAITLCFAAIALGRSCITSSLPNSIYSSGTEKREIKSQYYLHRASRIFGASRIAFLCAALVGGWCYHRATGLPFALQGVAALLGGLLIVTHLSRSEIKPIKKINIKQRMRDLRSSLKPIMRCFCYYGFTCTAGGFIFMYAGLGILRARGFEVSVTGILMVIALLVETASVQLAPRMHKITFFRHHAPWLFMLSGCLMLAYAPGSFLSASGLGFIFASFALGHKFAFLQLREQTNEANAGFVSGAYMSITGMAARLGLLFAGVLMDQFSIPILNLTVSLVLAATVLSVLAWCLRSRSDHNSEV